MSECNRPTCGCQNIYGSPWCKASTVAEPSPALAALAMRERAAAWMDSQALSDDELRQGYCFTPAYPVVAASAIRALPTTFTDAELLAAAMQFPAVRALVEAAERVKTSIENGGGGGVIDVVWLDGPTNETVCDHLAAALAPFRK